MIAEHLRRYYANMKNLLFLFTDSGEIWVDDLADFTSLPLFQSIYQICRSARNSLFYIIHSKLLALLML